MEDQEKQEPKLTDAEYDQKVKKLNLKKLEAENQDLEERLAEREMKRETKKQRSLSNGVVLNQIKATKAAAHAHCNHQKGGSGAEGFIGGQGDDSQYAVLKHRMPNSDVWVRCLRCGKTWKPPLEEQFTTKGKFDAEAFEAAKRDYERAVAFQTRNQTSGSGQFQWSDGGKYFRKVTKDVDLQ